MKKKLIYLIGATAVSVAMLAAALYFISQNVYAVDQLYSDPLSTNIQLVTADETGIHFSLQTPSFKLEERGKKVSITGLEQRLADPGVPALPFYSTFIALPPEAEISIEIRDMNKVREVVGPIQPAAGKEFQFGDGAEIIGNPKEIIMEDAEIYGRNAFFPETLYTLSEPMYFRDIRLVALQLYPIRYNPARGELQQARELDVQISFSGGRLMGLRPLNTESNQNQADLSNLVLNYDSAQAWRSLPANVLNAPETILPLGTDVYKIAVNEDGIYEVCQAELASAGMNVGSVNPNSLQMIYRGNDVAYEWTGDGDNNFEPGECVRFYGWAFAGTKIEQNYVSENVYWLWAGGTATNISPQLNQTNGGIKTSAWYTETREPELAMSFTRADQAKWATFPNEPDLWYWDRINNGMSSKTYTMTIHDPDGSSPNANFLVELMTRIANDTLKYTVTATINNPATAVTHNWTGHQNLNITNTISTNYLINGTNFITLDADLSQQVYLNRITVEYLRNLVARDDQLIFTDESGGDRLQVSGFSNDNARIWNISDPTRPVAVMNPAASGGTYTFGLNHPAGTKFIATTTDNIKAELSITQYVPESLDPAGNVADWLAITHSDFQTQAIRLAQHRAESQFGNLDTHIVDIEDVINQYGYGLPLPQAIRDYLTYALGNWQTAPSYVTLIGDTTVNPRGLECELYCPRWDANDTSFLITDLQFVDRFQGVVPVDHAFVMLTGDDVLADMAIGRLSVTNTTNAEIVVNKIISYENILLNSSPDFSETQFLFVADDDDEGGFFCAENQSTAAHLPLQYGRDHICQGTPEYPDVASVKTEMLSQIAQGLLLLNYRGHGSIEYWAGGSNSILRTTDVLSWQNTNKPTFILSADCLDGHFAYPGIPSISETYLRYDNNNSRVGIAGMWSSTGLGYTYEHTVLHQGFYDGLFVANGGSVGEAILYAKLQYEASGYHESEQYTFTLQGDPATIMPWGVLPGGDNLLFLPVVPKDG